MRFCWLLCLLATIYSQSCDDPHCISCQTAVYANNTENTICIKCSSGFSLQSSCVKALCSDPQCISCDPQNIYCEKCSIFFYLGETSCVIQSYVIVIPVVIFGLVLLSVTYCCIKYICIRRRAITSDANRPELNHSQSQQQSGTMEVINLDANMFDFQVTKDKCSICLEENCDLITSCDHYFHINCFSGWMKRGNKCPLCNNTDIQNVTVILCMTCKKRKLNLNLKNRLSFLKLPRLRKQKCEFCTENSKIHLNSL